MIPEPNAGIPETFVCLGKSAGLLQKAVIHSGHLDEARGRIVATQCLMQGSGIIEDGVISRCDDVGGLVYFASLVQRRNLIKPGEGLSI